MTWWKFGYEKRNFEQSTWFLAYSLLVMSWGEMQFGLDSTTFGSIQIMPSFLQKFGTLNAAGKHVIEKHTRAVMGSIGNVGYGVGCLISDPLVEYFGFKKSLHIMCAIQYLGVLVEAVAPNWQAWASGRCITYVTIGIMENIGPGYSSEVTPAPLRGFAIAMVITNLSVGQLISTGIFAGLGASGGKHVWLAPILIQLLPTVLITLTAFTAAESPRWLLSKGRKEEALKEIQRLRPKRNIGTGTNELEVDLMEQAVNESRLDEHNSSWIDLFRGTNLRRTMVAIGIWTLNQWVGSTFVNSYSGIFYGSFGYSDQEIFNFGIIFSGWVLLVGTPMCILYDYWGRRTVLIVFTSLSIPFLAMVAGLGSMTNPSRTALNVVVASIMLFRFFSGMGILGICFVIAAEVGTMRLRKKTLALSTTCGIVSAWVVNYAAPYMLDAMGANVAYLFCGVNVLCLILTVLFVPEMKNRSLEELDEMFEKRLWAWQFAKYETTGVGRAIAELELHGAAVADEGVKGEATHIEGDGQVDGKGDMLVGTNLTVLRE